MVEWIIILPITFWVYKYQAFVLGSFFSFLSLSSFLLLSRRWVAALAFVVVRVLNEGLGTLRAVVCCIIFPFLLEKYEIY